MMRRRLAKASFALPLLAVSVAHASPPAGSSSSPPSSSSPGDAFLEPGPTETLTPMAGVSVVVAPPKAWQGAQLTDTSAYGVSDIPGASVVVARTWRPGGAATALFSDSAVLVCISAPVLEWSDGTEQMVFDRMNALVRAEFKKRVSIDAYDPSNIEAGPKGYRMKFRGRGDLEVLRTDGSRALLEDSLDKPHSHGRLVGEHLVSFSTVKATALICSYSCGETERPGQKQFVCDPSLARLDVGGEVSKEPQISSVARAIARVRERPFALVGVVIGAFVVLVGAVLALVGLSRSQKRPTAAA